MNYKSYYDWNYERQKIGSTKSYKVSENMLLDYLEFKERRNLVKRRRQKRKKQESQVKS